MDYMDLIDCMALVIKKHQYNYGNTICTYKVVL